MSKPGKIQRTVSPIHFEDLSSDDFERLTFAYINKREKWVTLEWLGQRGHDGARDLWGVLEKRTYCFQCANRRRLTFAKIKKDIDTLVNNETIPDNFIVNCGGPVSANLRRRIIDYSKSIGIKETNVWSGVEFEESLRENTPDLIERFFEGVAFPEIRQLTAIEYAFSTIKMLSKPYKRFIQPVLRDKRLMNQSNIGILMCEITSKEKSVTRWTVLVNNDWLKWAVNGQQCDFKLAEEIPFQQVYGQVPCWPDEFESFLIGLSQTKTSFEWRRHKRGYLTLSQILIKPLPGLH